MRLGRTNGVMWIDAILHAVLLIVVLVVFLRS
jgi:hypothetical protein